MTRKELGNLIHLWGGKYSKFPKGCVVGPSWPFSLVLLTLICVAGASHLYYVVWQMSFVWQLVDVIVFGALLYNFLDTVCSDPGIVRPDSDDAEKRSIDDVDATECSTCHVRGVHRCHCSTCDVCYEELDHHCPWMSKCVAKKSLASFYNFLFLLFGSILFIMTSSIVKLTSDQARANGR